MRTSPFCIVLALAVSASAAANIQPPASHSSGLGLEASCGFAALGPFIGPEAELGISIGERATVSVGVKSIWMAEGQAYTRTACLATNGGAPTLIPESDEYEGATSFSGVLSVHPPSPTRFASISLHIGYERSRFESQPVDWGHGWVTGFVLQRRIAQGDGLIVVPYAGLQYHSGALRGDFGAVRGRYVSVPAGVQLLARIRGRVHVIITPLAVNIARDIVEYRAGLGFTLGNPK